MKKSIVKARSKVALFLAFMILIEAPMQFQVSNSKVPIQVGLNQAVAKLSPSQFFNKSISTSQSGKVALNDSNYFFKNNPFLKKMAIENPYVEQFMRETDDLNQVRFEYSASDPALDETPFFLSSQVQKWQSYTGQTSNSQDFYWSKNGNSFSLSIPSTKKSLSFNLPLTPITSTNEFIFLSADSIEFFKTKSQSKTDIPDINGLFFINRSTLFDASLSGQPVPIFFLPLPKVAGSWVGDVQSLALEDADTITFMNSDNHAVMVDLTDVNFIESIGRLNLLMASTLTMQNHPEFISQLIKGGETPTVAPVNGSTLGFGTVFTGLDLINPEKSFWKKQDSADLQEKFNSELKSFASIIQSQKFGKYSLFSSLATSLFLPGLAQAAGSDIHLDPQVVQKFVNIAVVFALVGLGSFIAKITSPKLNQKLDKIYEEVLRTEAEAKAKAKVKAGGQVEPVADIPVSGIKRALYGWAHLSVHGISTVGSFGNITAGHLTNMLFDSFLPDVSAGEHTYVRRVILNNSLLFSLNRASRVPVSPKTFVLGALVLGTVDTAFVGMQYAWTNPALAQAIYPYADAYTQGLILKAYDPNNPTTIEYNINATARTGSGYLAAGASSYSLERKSQILEIIEKEINDEILGEGKNPFDPAFAQERENKIKERLDFLMQQSGLPPQSHFMYDANSVYEKFVQGLGYSKLSDEEAKETYILSQRILLTGHVLRRSQKIAQTAEGMDPQLRSEVESLLSETINSMSFVRGAWKNGLTGIKKARQLRQELSLLSYNGPVNIFVKHLPATWEKNYSPEAVRAASIIFRQSLMSYLRANGQRLVEAVSEEALKFAEQAEVLALLDLMTAYKDKDRGLQQLLETHQKGQQSSQKEAVDNYLKSKYGYELAASRKLHILTLIEKKEMQKKAEQAQMPKKSWLEQKQEMKAVRDANQELMAYLAEKNGMLSSQSGTIAIDSNESREIWKKSYAKSMAKQVGLRLDFTANDDSEEGRIFNEVLGQVVNASETKTKQLLTSNIENQQILSRLTDFEKMKFEAWIYSLNFLSYYKAYVVEKSVLSPTSIYQPGKLQRLRQTSVFRNSKTLTLAARLIEGLHDDLESTQVGWKGLVARTIPFPLPFNTDFNTSFIRNLRGLTIGLTATYLYATYGPWQLNLPYGSYAFYFFIQGLTIMAPSQWLNRTFRMIGVPPMGSIMGKVIYSIPYAWATFFGMLPAVVYGPEVPYWFSEAIPNFFHAQLLDPIMGYLSQLTREQYITLGLALVPVLDGLFKFLFDSGMNFEQIKNYVKAKTVEFKSSKVAAKSATSVNSSAMKCSEFILTLH